MKSNVIALIVPDIINPFFANIAGVIIDKARSCGYIIELFDTLENLSEERRTLENTQLQNIDGIILVPSGSNPSYVLDVFNANVPIVLIDRYFENCDIPYISTNNYLGSYNATEYLINAGHRNILCIQGQSDSITTRERARGYIDAMNKYGNSEYCNIVGKDYTLQNGYIETKISLSSENHPTAIYTMSSTILLGALKAIQENNLSIPEDISILSFDNQQFMDFLNPPITRVKQPIEDIGSMSFKLLLDEINNKEKSTKQILLNPELIIRKSVKIITK